jgi:hypothetical protein
MAAQNPVLAAMRQGKEEGRREIREEVLAFLYQRYMDPSIHRGTPKGEAILELVDELSRLMKV